MLIFLLFIGFFVVRYVLVLRQYKRSSYYVVTRNSFFYVRSDKGRFGEYCTYLKLRDLEEQGGKFLFNVYIPTQNGTAEIDLLMICRRGSLFLKARITAVGSSEKKVSRNGRRHFRMGEAVIKSTSTIRSFKTKVICKLCKIISARKYLYGPSSYFQSAVHSRTFRSQAQTFRSSIGTICSRR